VDLVPNAVDTEQFHAPPRGKQPSPTVGLMYSTTRFKGCDISLDAVRRAARNVAGLRLAAFGIDQPSPELPLPDGAAFFHQPSQTMLKDVYSRCDAWLFGSRTEGFGLPLLEAMACRTPVVATPAGAAPELLAEGGGVLVEPENPQDMADAIVRVCGLSAEAWRAMSDAAYSTATRYTWDDATDLFEAALRRAITRAGRGEIAGCGWGSDK
jgi:glycosyltransferase involved in cell wall biosynthesis